MKKQFSILAVAAFFAACSEAPVEPTDLSPSFSENAAGSPAGLGNCNPRDLRDVQNGQITPGSCNSNAAIGRRSQYYQTATPGAGQMLTVSFNGTFAPVLGVKQATGNPIDGIVWGAFGFDANEAAAVSFIGSSATQQVFVGNRDANTFGKFELRSAVEPISYSCDIPTIYEAPVSFTASLDAAHACHVTVQFSPFPDAIGKPILSQFYYGKLVPGNTYEVRIEGVSEAFNPALTVYSGGGVAGQSVGPVPANGVRTLVFTPSVLAYYTIEIASGGPDGNGGWSTPAGSYTLSVTRL